jgi:hypothetical protein
MFLKKNSTEERKRNDGGRNKKKTRQKDNKQCDHFTSAKKKMPLNDVNHQSCHSLMQSDKFRKMPKWDVKTFLQVVDEKEDRVDFINSLQSIKELAGGLWDRFCFIRPTLHYYFPFHPTFSISIERDDVLS